MLMLAAGNLQAQVNLPASINFSFNDPVKWSDGIAEDGDGGSSNINGITMQIFPATASFAVLPNATMVWHNATYYTSPPSDNFTGITPGPDVQVTNNGVPAMVIKSSSQAVNFNLQSIRLLDWGGTSPVLATYDNGVLKGTISPLLPTDGTSLTLSQPTTLPANLFQNIDEIRMYPQGGQPVFWIAVNNISLGSAPLPVNLTRFDATVLKDQSVQLQWETAMERNARDFTIEESLDAVTFYPIGTVAAAGDLATGKAYSFLTQKIAQKVFLRLKQSDKDGQTIYSKVIMVTPNIGKEAVAVYPNPATNRVYVQAEESISDIILYSLSGNQVKAVKASGKNASFTITELPQGSYTVAVRCGASTYHILLVKQ